LDPDWAEQIVANAAIRPGELIVELGAGTGALTLPLIEAGARVIAVELHAGRARRLREKVNDRAKVVECDLEDFSAPGRPFRVVANPPYALTAAVLAFTARASYLTAADLVLQRAVVRRIVDQGRRHLRRFDAHRGLPLPRTAFVPPPPVDSVVLQLRRRIAVTPVGNLGSHRLQALCTGCNVCRPPAT
jgi:23S rRNA (adenine-N6)-dimethyltransferase